MNGVYDYKIDVSELPQVCKMHPVYGGNLRPAKIILKNLNELVESSSRRGIVEQPQYQYCIGNKQAYADFLIPLRGKSWARAAINEEHLTLDDMYEKFDKILHSDKKYLEPPFEHSYICTHSDAKTIFDGVHRASVLLSKGFEVVPIAVL